MIETMANIFGMILYFVEGYLFYRVLCNLMEPRKKLSLKLLGWLGLSMSVSVVIFPQDPVNITILIPLLVVSLAVNFQGKWIVKASTVMMFLPIIVSFNFLWKDMMTRVFFRFIGGFGTANAVFSNLTCLIDVAFWYCLWRFFDGKLSAISSFLDNRSWVLLDIICLAPMVSIFINVYYTPDDSYKVYPGMVACLVTSIGSIDLATYLADRIRANMERKNLRLQQNYYEELEHNQLQIRKLRHDMNNHLLVVGELLHRGDLQGALEYFGKLSGYMETRNRQFCKNGIVNALLNVKYNAAMEAEIDTFFHISIDQMMDIDDISLCTIFANTLDNAIEACLKIPQTGARRLSVKARCTQNGYFSYEIVNSKQNTITEKKGQLLTDKANRQLHGLGITAVREMVEKYRGTMDISYTEEEFRVVILIAI